MMFVQIFSKYNLLLNNFDQARLSQILNFYLIVSFRPSV